MSVKATLIELAYRIVKFDKKLSVHLNGEDNNYPERVERTINNSATAKPCAQILKKYIIGNGFEDDESNRFVVNKETGQTLRQLLSDVAESYAYHKGNAIHVNVNGNNKTSSLLLLPFGHCRVGKKDDKKYNAKIGICEKWAESIVKPTDIQLIDVYNTDKKVRSSQIKQAGSIQKYKGQIYFFHPDKTIYPLSHIDSVMLDADSEYQASVFKNTSMRKGFFGKTIMVTPPLLGELGGKPNEVLNDEERIIKKHLEGERGNFKEVLKQFVGVKNVDGMLHIEMEHSGDDIEKMLKVIEVKTNIDDKTFAYTESSVANNIRKAYQNIPSILIESSDNSIFGQSGALLKEAQRFFQEQTADEREYIEHHINFLMKDFEEFNMPEGGLKIKPLIEINGTNN